MINFYSSLCTSCAQRVDCLIVEEKKCYLVKQRRCTLIVLHIAAAAAISCSWSTVNSLFGGSFGEVAFHSVLTLVNAFNARGFYKDLKRQYDLVEGLNFHPNRLGPIS